MNAHVFCFSFISVVVSFFQALIRIHNYKLQPSVVYQIIKLHILLNKISVYFDEFCCNFCK